jgi:hypothetical protein
MKKITLLALALLTSAAAVPAFAGEDVCLYRQYVDGWNARDNTSMIVEQFGRKYLVSLQGDCRDLHYSEGMGFRTLGRSGGPTCIGPGDRVVMRGGGAAMSMPSMCWVAKIQRYTEDMRTADKAAREAHQPLASY